MGNINALYNLVVVDVVLFEGYAYIFTDQYFNESANIVIDVRFNIIIDLMSRL